MLDTLQGKHAPLGGEPDFRYMLARDAEVPHEVLAFFGDKFVGQVVGPKQKVLEARRLVAASELSTPGYAALLYGWIYGKAPETVEDLLASKLLRKEELRHASGGTIEWRPGTAARSTWGSSSVLTPLIELAPPEMVSESERASYDRFAKSYQSTWSQYMDPAALRLAWLPGAPDTLRADLRILPLIENTEYREIGDLAGQTRIVVPKSSAGARVTVGIGAESPLRKQLSGSVLSAFRKSTFSIDFLGDWALAGIADRKRIANIARKFPSEISIPERHPREETEDEPSHTDSMSELLRIPAYAAIGIRSVAGATIALAAIREKVEESAPEPSTGRPRGPSEAWASFR